MEGQDNTEKDVMQIETQINRAIELIMQSYNGISAELLFKESVNCFEGLMAISQNTKAFRDFRHKQEVDTKYIMDGANYIISYMHFNPENNYYVTLGLPRNATQEQIKERWKNLMMLYHPDRQIGNEDWVSERAKKVNEAYSILKDKNLRASFDLKLLDKNKTDIVAQNRRDKNDRLNLFRMKRTDSISFSKCGRAGWNISWILIALYIFTVVAFIGFIYLQKKSSNLKIELSSGTGQNTPVIHKGQIGHSGWSLLSLPDYSDQNIAMSGSTVNKNENSDSNPFLTMQLVAAFQKNKEVKKFSEKQKNKDSITIKNEDKTEIAKSDNNYANNKKKDKPVLPSVKEVFKRYENVSTTLNDIKPVLREEVPAVKNNENSERTLQVVRSYTLSREDVEEFMQQYSNTYMKNDLNVFMSFFSKSVIENDRLNYNDIRNAYRETFTERINYYRIKNMNIKINGQQAIVTGEYSLNRYLSNEDRWVKYSGNITWILALENNTLKILRINYDR